MKKILLGLALLLSGCAHQTAHEYCSDPENAGSYRNYDQCYAERSAAIERRHNRMGHAFDGLANQQTPVQTNCTTTYYGGVAQTHCQ